MCGVANGPIGKGRCGGMKFGGGGSWCAKLGFPSTVNGTGRAFGGG
jgi:hypothetical protein